MNNWKHNLYPSFAVVAQNYTYGETAPILLNPCLCPLDVPRHIEPLREGSCNPPLYHLVRGVGYGGGRPAAASHLGLRASVVDDDVGDDLEAHVVQRVDGFPQLRLAPVCAVQVVQVRGQVPARLRCQVLKPEVAVDKRQLARA